MILCSRVACEEAATRGGLLIFQPNGLTATHAVYYACDEHGGTLADAVETWQTTPDAPTGIHHADDCWTSTHRYGKCDCGADAPTEETDERH